MEKWAVTFTAMHPRNPGETWRVGIPKKLVAAIQKDKAYAARGILVREILEGGTEYVFAGWDRLGKENGFIYVGHPSRDLRDLKIETPPPKNSAFLIFIAEDGSIEFWCWREWSDGRPTGVKGEQLWPTS